jgi:hypothetical protein
MGTPISTGPGPMAQGGGGPAGGAPQGGMSAVGDAMAGDPAAGQDALRAQLQQTAMQVRQIGDLVQQLAQSNPMFQQGAQQITQILKQMIITAAQAAPQQTASGAAVPGGAGV